MFLQEQKVSLSELSLALGRAVDMVSPEVSQHHLQVAYIAGQIAVSMDETDEWKSWIGMSGLFHDIGAFSLEERLETLEFETKHTEKHCEIGYEIFKPYPFFQAIAENVKYHHTYWNHGEGEEVEGNEIPLGSHLLHLADRIAVLTDTKKDILGEKDRIMEVISKSSGTMFKPDLVDIFLEVGAKDHFWLELASPFFQVNFRSKVMLPPVLLGMENLLEISRVFAQVIDFRSPFTATHSSGVSANAEKIGELAGLSFWECRMLKAAGYLHDLGKLAIPTSILDKPGALTREEMWKMKSHVFFTYQILDPIDELDTIKKWGALHHEKLNGQGYPFGLTGDELSLGARIMGVADIFCALREERPYRKGMEKRKAVEIIEKMVKENSLDKNIVGLLIDNINEIDDYRQEIQKKVARGYFELVTK